MAVTSYLGNAPGLTSEVYPSAVRPRVGFVSLGCPKNLVDSEVMMGLLDRAGAELTPHAEDAEILVVNTCSFIDSAKQESVNAILEMVQHKVAHGGRAQRLVVAGCLVERYRDEIQRNIPEVDAVVGTGELEAILEAAGLQRPAPARVPASPFTVLTAAQVATLGPATSTVESTQIRRAHSAVQQHSRPEGNGSQLRAHAEISATSASDHTAAHGTWIDAVSEAAELASLDSPVLAARLILAPAPKATPARPQAASHAMVGTVRRPRYPAIFTAKRRPAS